MNSKSLEGPGRKPRAHARDIRQEQILSHVSAKGVATAAELVELTGVSLMTVHRDLDDLARRGALRKFHGGVSAKPSTVFESSSTFRQNVQVEEKKALAEAALQLIEPGMSIMLDSSTTNLFLANLLAELQSYPLTIVTNYLPIMQAVRGSADIQLIGIGGDHDVTHDAFLGMGAVEAIHALRVDLVLLSTSAMTTESIFHQEAQIVMVKRAMMHAGNQRVLLMDHAKLGKTALHHLAPVTEFHHLLVDSRADEGFLQSVSERVPVITV